MLQNVHRKPCSIQIFRPHCTLCSYCGDISIKGEFLLKSTKLCNVHVRLLHEFTVISFDSESFLQITFRTQMLKLACLFSIQKANFHLRTKSKCVKFFKKLHFRQSTP